MTPSHSPRKILVVDDEDFLRKTLKSLLEKEGYEVNEADGGKTARTLLALDSFDAIISDINMPGGGGIDLLEFVKTTHPKTPVVLMTGFAKLFETKEAHALGVGACLAKPFKRDELLRAIEAVCGPRPEKEPPESADSAENYCKIDVDQFISGRELKFEIFIRLSDTKFTKIAHQGEDITMERIRLFKSKGISYLYIKKEDFAKYVGFNLTIARAVKNGAKLSVEKKAALLRHANEVILENLFLNGIDEASFQSAKELTTTTLSVLSESPECYELLKGLSESGDFVYMHSLGVSLYSAMIAKQLGWTSPATLFKMSTAGLLHDIGKKELDPAIAEKPRSALTRKEVELLETHPSRGAVILSSVSSIPPEVCQIVLHHHERCNGHGYPSALTKNKIIPMARVVAVADEFCKLALNGHCNTGLPPRIAMERLIAAHETALDPDFLVALMAVLKIEGLALRRAAKW